MKTMTRRKTIDDKLITNDIFDKIVAKVLDKFDNIYDLKQSHLLPILLDMNLSNKTIARVINYLLSGANATEGSIASLIRANKNKNDLLNDLLEKLEVDINE